MKATASRTKDEQVPPSGGEVVPIRQGAVPAPADVAELLESTAGQGVSTLQEDNLVPLVYVLQAQSPQTLKRNPAYIDGAEAGGIWLRNAADPVVPGDEGILFQPCYFSKDVVEWKWPREVGSQGGFIGRHDFREGEDITALAERLGAEKKVDPRNPNTFSWVIDGKSELIETRYHTGFVIREGHNPAPFVIPLSSTGHTFSRTWMFKMNQKLTPSRKIAASYAYLYRLKTVFKSNASGEWYMFDVDDGTPVWVHYSDPNDYQEALLRGRDLAVAFESGAKQAAAPDESAAGRSAPDTTAAEQAI
jgi:hypothetical protein